MISCNLNSSNHLEMLIKGLSENSTLETLDLSDNLIRDQDGLFIVRYMKLQAEKRENALW